MQTGAITQYIDVAQLMLYAFWIFFAGLIYYLHQENKREGYPLESNVPGKTPVEGFPPVPTPKTFYFGDGSSVSVPRANERGVAQPSPSPDYEGAPTTEIGRELRAGVGPGAYAARDDVPDMMLAGGPRIAPLRASPGFDVSHKDVDPRGLPVVGCDGVVGGVVHEVWVDRSEYIARYLEVSVGAGANTTKVLLPFGFARVSARRVFVDSIRGAHFAGVPTTRHGDVVTRLEEERIMAYYGAGTLYATPGRAEPLL